MKTIFYVFSNTKLGDLLRGHACGKETDQARGSHGGVDLRVGGTSGPSIRCDSNRRHRTGESVDHHPPPDDSYLRLSYGVFDPGTIEFVAYNKLGVGKPSTMPVPRSTFYSVLTETTLQHGDSSNAPWNFTGAGTITIDNSGANTAAIARIRADSGVDIEMRQSKFLPLREHPHCRHQGDGPWRPAPVPPGARSTRSRCSASNSE